jgi:hypothetical protein
MEVSDMIKNLNQVSFQNFGMVMSERVRSAAEIAQEPSSVLNLVQGDATVCRATADTLDARFSLTRSSRGKSTSWMANAIWFLNAERQRRGQNCARRFFVRNLFLLGMCTKFKRYFCTISPPEFG